MIHPGYDWDTSLQRTVDLLSGISGEPLIFLEGREDLAVQFASGLPASIVHTCARGVTVETGGSSATMVSRSAPSPDDLEGIAAGGTGRIEAGSRSVHAPVVISADDGIRAADLIIESVPASVGRRRLQASGRYVAFHQEVRIAKPGSGIVCDTRTGSRVRLEISSLGGKVKGTAIGEQVLKPGAGPDVDALVTATVNRAITRIDAGACSAGEFIAVFAPGTGGILLHELIGHSLEADKVAGGRSLLVESDGSFVFEGVKIVDDPRRGRGGWKVDDEGEPATAVPLFLSGKRAGLLHDRSTARAVGRDSTGHGRRSSYLEPVMPRMGCTFLASGRQPPEEILRSTAKGIYVRRMEAASSDPSSGTAMFKVFDADRIIDGKLDQPLLPFMMVIDLAELLSGLDMIGNDLELDSCIGSCLRNGQPLVVSVGAPTFRTGLVRVLEEKVE